jgi:hypothetical protein
MNQKDKFLGFLGAIDAPVTLIESIRDAFLLLESEDQKYECRIEFKASDRDRSLEKMLEVYNGNTSGIFVLDQEGDSIPPVMSVYSSNPVGGNRTHNIEYDITADGISSIILRASDNGRFEAMRDSIKSLLENLGKLGNGGHSFDIRFYPNSLHGKMKRFGWDGDGADRIDTDSIKITKV